AEKHRADEEIRRRERMYHQLFDSMAEAVIHHGGDGRVLSANPATEHILGVPPRLLAGRSSIDVPGRAVTPAATPVTPDAQPHMTALHTRQAVRDIILGFWNPRENERRW